MNDKVQNINNFIEKIMKNSDFSAMLDDKNQEELDFLSNYVSKLKILKEQVLDKEELVNLYSQAKEELVNDLAKKVIVSEEQDNYFNILNDIFEYFWSGYPLLS